MKDVTLNPDIRLTKRSNMKYLKNNILNFEGRVYTNMERSKERLNKLKHEEQSRNQVRSPQINAKSREIDTNKMKNIK